MKILHVLRTFHPSWGGPVQGVKHLASQAHKRGYQVEVACLDEAGSPWLANLDLKVHPVGPASLGNFGYTRRLDAWLAANIRSFDIVVVNGIWMYFSDSARRASQSARVPYVVFPHGALDPWFKRTYPVKQFKKSAYWALVEHKVFRDAAAVMFTSDEELTLSQDAFSPYVCNARLTGYGIEDPLAARREPLDQLKESSTETAFAKELNDRPYLLFLARLHQKKGLDLLLHAISRNLRNYRDHAFVIAGPGPGNYTSAMKSLGSELGLDGHLVWTGPLYGETKWEAVRGAEAYVLPSHQENFGISVVESLACHVPVLITNRVNIWREILSCDGGLVESDDLNGICNLLRRWSEMPSPDKARMRTYARQCFLTHFEINETSNSFFDFLLKTVNATPVDRTRC